MWDPSDPDEPYLHKMTKRLLADWDEADRKRASISKHNHTAQRREIMAYEHKPGCGTVFKNEHYEKGGNKPLLKGQCKTLDGVLCDVAIWAPDEGKTYYSFKLSPPYKKPEVAPEPEFEDEDAVDDDLPF